MPKLKVAGNFASFNPAKMVSTVNSLSLYMSLHKPGMTEADLDMALDSLSDEELQQLLRFLGKAYTGALALFFDDPNRNIQMVKDAIKTAYIARYGISENAGSSSMDLINWLKNIEIGNIKDTKNENYVLGNYDEPVGIKIQNAYDGYITLAYGYIIQTEEDAIKYGFTSVPGYENVKVWEEQSISTVNDIIQKHIKKYGDGIENPAILSLQEAEELLISSLVSYEKTAERFASETGLTYSQNEMDAMTSLVYNGNRAYDEDSMLYHVLRQDEEATMDVLHKADDNGWYEGQGGLLRRRLMEYNIFVNSDYEFYDDYRLDELKRITGFSD